MNVPVHLIIVSDEICTLRQRLCVLKRAVADVFESDRDEEKRRCTEVQLAHVLHSSLFEV